MDGQPTVASLIKVVFDYKTWWRAFFIACLLLASCSLGASPTPQVVPTCISSNPRANPYRLSENTITDIIYDAFKLGITPLKDAQYQAFTMLGKCIEHWSAYTDILMNNGIGGRIMVTYLSPELVYFIVLNHELSELNRVHDDFQRDLNGKLEKLAKREEMLFIITITAPSYNDQFDASQQLVLDIPMSQMALTNASDLKVFTTHDDHVLEELIPVTRRPVTGFVGFPLSVMQNDQCNWIMNPTYNTTITIDIPSISVNGQPDGPQSWSIPYAPLVDSGVDDDLPILVADPKFDYSRISPLNMPPPPVWDTSVTGPENYWETYWQDVGRYIWSCIMPEDYP